MLRNLMKNYDSQFDVVGERHGRLVVLRKCPGGYECRCDCGNLRVVRRIHLNHKSSCGECDQPPDLPKLKLERVFHRCRSCGQLGHNSRNKRFHPK